MILWIHPTNKPVPIIVRAETAEEARLKIAQCPDYDGARIFTLQAEFYASLCETGAAGPVAVQMKGGTLGI